MGALDYAVWVAKQFRAAIYLVHVYPPDEASAVPGAAHLLLQSAEAIERLNEQLKGIHQKHAPTFRPENCHIRSGRPYEEIIRLAREIDADLIALSTRGHSGLKHLLLGSTASRGNRNKEGRQVAKRSLSAPSWFPQISRNVRLPGRSTRPFWQENLAPYYASSMRCIRIQITCSLTAPVFVFPGWPKPWKKQPGKKCTRLSRWIFCAV